jgi:hypothetical protein
VLRELQINLTIDTQTGVTRAYLLELTQDGQWTWVTDTEFGPNETTLDIVQWFTRALTRRKVSRLR